MSKAIEKKITDMIAPEVAGLGYELVRVLITGGGKYGTLQIMVERQDGAGMTVEDCAKISKTVSAKFETDKDIADKYDLEVSSPGIDRPLVKLTDFSRFQGHVAKVELAAPMVIDGSGGQRRFEGKIVRVAGEEVELNTEKGTVSVPFAAIEKAKLILTDELLKAAQRGEVSH